MKKPPKFWGLLHCKCWPPKKPASVYYYNTDPLEVSMLLELDNWSPPFIWLWTTCQYENLLKYWIEDKHRIIKYCIAIKTKVQITSFPAYGYLYGNNKSRGPRISQQKLKPMLSENTDQKDLVHDHSTSVWRYDKQGWRQ